MDVAPEREGRVFVESPQAGWKEALALGGIINEWTGQLKALRGGGRKESNCMG